MPGMYNWLYEYISIRYCVAYAGSVMPGKYFLLWCQVCGCMHTGKYYYFGVRYVGVCIQASTFYFGVRYVGVCIQGQCCQV